MSQTLAMTNTQSPMSLVSQQYSFQRKLENSDCQALAFIDPSVEDSSSLIAGLLPRTQAILLDSQRDGIEQISEILKGYRQLQTVHIISHGSPGCVYLGNSVLNRDTLSRYQDELQSWQTALAADADILLYGCRVADVTSHASFLEDLAALTNANIAASTSITGNAKQGGNWNLDVQIGKVASPLAVTESTQQHYAGTLATFTVNTTDDENDGNADEGNGLSLRDAILQANQNSESDVIELTGGETYNLSLSDTDTTNFETDNPDASVADLDITGGSNVTVRGVGDSKAIIDASNIGGGDERRDRVFEVLSDGNLTLENVEVTGGKAAPPVGPAIIAPQEGGEAFAYILMVTSI